MKKILSPIIIILLLIVSFYYTNKSVSVLKNADPIMKAIKETEEKYKIEPINAQIIGNSIISGKTGKTIDYEKSYNKMKRYGTYNESLTSLKELQPVVSINDNYDKYVVSGNKDNRNISLVFLVKENESINNILGILKNKNVSATFFLDGTYLEKNLSTIKNITDHELEILSYNQEFEETFIKTSISYLNSITGKNPKYCYTEKEDENILNTCKKLNLHTIKPTLVLNKNIYHEIKENLSNSIIISLEINRFVEKELSTTIDYLKKKGYNIITLDDVVKEDN